MTVARESSSWETALADANKRVIVFPLSASDESLAGDIQEALELYFLELALEGPQKCVFIMGSWLPQPGREQFQRICEFGKILRKIKNLGLWVLSAEKSADDIRRYASGPLYITGKLMSAGVPVFEPGMGKSEIEEALKRMRPEKLSAWIDLLSTIGPGPVDQSHWRHDVRGRILGTVHLYLQSPKMNLAEALRADPMASTLLIWGDLLNTRPFCEQLPRVASAGIEVIKVIQGLRASSPEKAGYFIEKLAQSAKELERALDAARERGHREIPERNCP